MLSESSNFSNHFYHASSSKEFAPLHTPLSIFPQNHQTIYSRNELPLQQILCAIFLDSSSLVDKVHTKRPKNPARQNSLSKNLSRLTLPAPSRLESPDKAPPTQKQPTHQPVVSPPCPVLFVAWKGREEHIALSPFHNFLLFPCLPEILKKYYPDEFL